MRKSLFLALLVFILFNNAYTQTIAPELLSKKWDAYWIATSNSFQRDYGVYHFRKAFLLNEVPSSFIIHVSADNRYKLFVNGTMVSTGPARADLYHWNFETVDIASYLVKGNNVIAAIVWNFGLQKAQAQISFQTAFILQGNSSKEKIINTNRGWKCIQDNAYNPLPPNLVDAYYAAGPGEKIDYRLYPAGWQQPQYNDTAWIAATELFNGLPKGVFEHTEGWMLVPRPIPPMELKPQRLAAVSASTGIRLPAVFPKSKSAFEVPANTKVTFLLDNQSLTTAYAVLQFSKGKGAQITLGYAEALYIDEGAGKNWKLQVRKGNRNEVAGKRFVGVKDELTADGKAGQTFTSLSWRTYRYLQIEIQTANEAITVDDVYGIFTGYPFQMKARFNATDTVLNTILEVGWRTARLCATETYMDCPFYEQLQYVADTRIQALVSLFNSGDDRLMRNAITQLDHSRIAEGITLSRYPAAASQEIPTFALWWIGMLRDYYMYRGDTAFVKGFLPGERQVLSFFAKYQQKDGSLRNAPYWEFTDYAEGWPEGVAPVDEEGSSAVLDLQLLLAYQTAARLEEELGMKEYAHMYNMAAARLSKTIKDRYWDAGRQLFADTKEKKLFSQHANTLAILTNLVIGPAAKQLAEKILAGKNMIQGGIFFQYYVNQAITKAGLGDLYLDQLQIWKDNLAFGMTTWAEIRDINEARSDCHAWGASPNIELYRIVLGIDSDAPGFDKIRITPHLGSLTQASGSIPHPKGEITVSYKIDPDGTLNSNISIPKETSGTFVWKGKTTILKGGANNFSVDQSHQK